MATQLESFFNSLRGRRVVMAAVFVIIALLIFHAGYALGSRRILSRERFFMMHGPSGTLGMPHVFIGGGHGALGTIENISTSTLAITTRDGATQMVVLTPQTEYVSGSGFASSSVLRRGDLIVAIGLPADDGSITADLIRVMSSSTAARQ